MILPPDFIVYDSRVNYIYFALHLSTQGKYHNLKVAVAPEAQATEGSVPAPGSGSGSGSGSPVIMDLSCG